MMKKVFFMFALVLALASCNCQQKQAADKQCEKKECGAEKKTCCAEKASVIRLNCTVEVTPENRDSVVYYTKQLVEASLKDEGNISYDLFESTTRPGVLLIFETWKDQPSLDKHSAAPHFTDLVPKIQKLSKMTIEQFSK